MCQATLFTSDYHFGVSRSNGVIVNIKKINNSYIYSDKKGKLKLKKIKIYSSGLIENLAIAIKVARDFNINDKIILKALPKIKLLGRLQFIKKGKLRKLLSAKEDLLVDGCHSIEAIFNHKSFKLHFSLHFFADSECT